ncbi:MAG: GntR family transcriptional regulator [Capsulimonadaceae bacterium]|nr:GntR family transcriptional regulator [Capsulimonadaceae bacterium]
MPIDTRLGAAPKYVQLADHLRKQIKRGTLKPGDRLPSQAELKAQYGISQATMERLHASLEQEGLIVRRQGSGTFVAPPPERIRTGIVGVTGVGFLVDRSFYWMHILEGIRSVATPAGFQIMLIDPRASEINTDSVDGLFVTGWDKPEFIRTFPNVETVELITASGSGSSVVADDFGGGVIATEYLLGLGHKRIAMLGNEGYHISEIRAEGYKYALKRAGIEPDPAWLRMIADLWPEFQKNGQSHMNKWLDEDWDKLGCTALLAHNDPTALGAIAAFRKRGYDVPGKVSVVGYDATGLYDNADPLLTSVAVPLQEVGRIGMSTLLARINDDGDRNGQEVVPVTLRHGHSAAAIADTK